VSDIQVSNPQLDVLMIELRERLQKFIQHETEEIAESLGIYGQGLVNLKAASFGELREILFVITIRVPEGAKTEAG
jgi:hypothetical protein